MEKKESERHPEGFFPDHLKCKAVIPLFLILWKKRGKFICGTFTNRVRA